MKIFLILLLAFTVSCATMGAKNPLGIEVKGIARLSESNAGIAIEIAFNDAMKKLNIAKCKFFNVLSICIFPKEDKVEVILLGKECNPPKIAGR